MMRLEDLRGGLIVSVQAWPGSAIDDPQILAAMAHAAMDNGARGVRVQGVATIRATRARLPGAPIVGLIKREYPGFQPYITPSLREVAEVVEAGADVVAFDATERTRPNGCDLMTLVAEVHRAGLLAMADCARLDDARSACQAGADIVASTLCGYTDATRGTQLPALELIAQMRRLGRFTVAEGGVASPEHVRAAFAAGADATVVGTAITNVDARVRDFVAGTRPEAL